MDNALDGLQLLHFEIEDDGSNQVIYEGLARREYFLGFMYKVRPGIKMSPIDYIRNYILEHF